MKKSFFLALIFFFSFSVSNLHLNAKTINITGEPTLSQYEKTNLLKKYDCCVEKKKKITKNGIVKTIFCIVCGRVIAHCICKKIDEIWPSPPHSKKPRKRCFLS